jgi:hypothetical protein
MAAFGLEAGPNDKVKRVTLSKKMDSQYFVDNWDKNIQAKTGTRPKKVTGYTDGKGKSMDKSFNDIVFEAMGSSVMSRTLFSAKAA